MFLSGLISGSFCQYSPSLMVYVVLLQSDHHPGADFAHHNSGRQIDGAPDF